MKLVQILGPGCSRCKKLAENAQQAIVRSGIEATVERVTGIQDILSFGVLLTPALLIDGKVRSVGRLLSPEEIHTLLAD